MSRVSWNEYFMQIAEQVSTRATCNRLHVGAVVVRDKTILSTGYNGSIKGTPHCDDADHQMVDGHCVRTVHAEANSLIQAARNGVKIEGAEMYVTAFPCYGCFKLIANSGIKTVFFRNAYRVDEKVLEAAKTIGLNLVKLEEKEEEVKALPPTEF